MATDFVHLHLHSSFSLKDGIQPAIEIGPLAKARGMNAVALTDHGYMGGIPDFVKGCRSAGIKPIIGMEAYIAFEDATLQKSILIDDIEKDVWGNPTRKLHSGHLVLLAKNEIGYRNLLKLMTFSYAKGFFKKPRIDLEHLEQYSEGLIGSSACLASPMAAFWRLGLRDRAMEWATTLERILGKGNFFLEIQNNNIDDQHSFNHEWIIPISKELDIPLLFTGDVHQQNQDQWKLKGLVQCMGFQELPHELKYGMQDHNAWLFDSEFALGLIKKWELPVEAMENSVKIAGMIDGEYFSKMKVNDLTFEEQTPEESAQILRKLSMAGLVKVLGLDSYDQVPLEYTKPLEYELGVIEDFKYSAYFLTVRDYINIAKEQGTVTGPGRGSSGGSIIAWSLGITGAHLDPVKYGLYFERFLNPGRVTIKLDIPELKSNHV